MDATIFSDDDRHSRHCMAGLIGTLHTSLQRLAGAFGMAAGTRDIKPGKAQSVFLAGAGMLRATVNPSRFVAHMRAAGWGGKEAVSC